MFKWDTCHSRSNYSTSTNYHVNRTEIYGMSPWDRHSSIKIPMRKKRKAQHWLFLHMLNFLTNCGIDTRVCI
jgi:hypothetical protein